MSKLLSLESSAETCSVAVNIDGEVFFKVHSQPRQHAQVFLPMVDEVLAESGLSLNQLDGIGFSRGPGSFTGIRICFGIVQGLALGVDLPVVPVSTLQALAIAAERSGFAIGGDRVAAAFDARMHEVYFAEYALSGSLPELISREQVVPVKCSQEWLPEMATGVVAVGSGWGLSELEPHKPGRCHPELNISAEDISVLAAKLYQAGRIFPIDEVAPVYLRDEVTWKKRQPIRKIVS